MTILYYVAGQPHKTLSAAQAAQQQYRRRIPIITYIDGQPIEAC